MKFDTLAIHGGQKTVDPAYGSVMPPIYQTSTFKQSSPGDHNGYEYARSGNPTRSALERSLASIEKGNHGIAFASGMAAIDAVLRLLEPGDEVISTADLYGGTYRLFREVYEKSGIVFKFVNMADLSDIDDLISDKTKLIWVETPTNPMMKIIDIAAVSKVKKDRNLLLVVDNTFATPYLQRPLELGADIVMHSATKYIGGHSDLIMGALVVDDDELSDKLYFIQKAVGAVPGPQDCFLAIRGIKTLHLRMQRHCENAQLIAEFLKSQGAVAEVNYPGLSSHKSYALASEQMSNYGGMLSFSLKSDSIEEATQFLSNLRIFALAESLGGVESLAGHPAIMTHASIPRKDRYKIGITDSLIRLSVGVEDHEDLIADLQSAFGKI